MGKVVFSSWGGKVVDHRDGPPGVGPSWAGEFGGRQLKAFIGWDGLLVTDPDVDLLAALQAYYQAVQGESCGRCVPCRVGTRVIYNVLARIAGGEGLPSDLDLLRRVARVVRDSSLCELGQAGARAVFDFLDYYSEALRPFLEEESKVIVGHGAPAAGARKSQVQVLASGRVLVRSGSVKGRAAGSPAACVTYKPFVTAPCLKRCPAHLDIPAYIEAIKDGRYEESLAIIRQRTALAGVLGRVCVHPCEENCRRGNVDEPLAIRGLKRFVADYEVKRGRQPVAGCGVRLFAGPWRPAGQPGGEESTAITASKKVAIIGSGPAGLSAAYQLAGRGYKVTIFEALPVAGGMLAVGIPSYRLPRDILAGEIEAIKALGVTINLNTRVGVDVTLDQLQCDYNAVFIATGLHASSRMGVAGEDEGYAGFIPGVKFLRDLNLDRCPSLEGKVVAVVGGGNVAMDCARSALRLGAREVRLIYRRSRAEMPAHATEVNDAEAEGVIYHFQVNPTALVAEKGSIKGMQCVRMELGEPDDSGRRRPVPVPGSEFFLPCDIVVPAIGQAADLSFLEGRVEVGKRGTISVDPVTLATSVPGVFAGGDVVLGARTVVEAVAQGNRAAVSIDQYLRQGTASPTVEDQLDAWLEKVGVYDPGEEIGIYGGRSRQEERVAPAAERVKDFREVEGGFDFHAGRAEAERCLRCYRVGMMVLAGEGESNG
ncbi:MAG: formate dehydrogenase beta subunit [Moorella sp. (in: firmicutes)]|uniref:NADPH-Fe(3+) oxidoreductase subunit beta n=1 Tax=Neomoorella thermoacetica TaxID=1525 RepID=A0A1J5NF89_NEOTH|nr:formate dehydrogenase beta subunit [Moorella sp. (in: firmicutes)]OIQ57024.1 NADPH-Fe(3+) oxidoreductase subunit beta [Moorella thermoacetica]